MKVHVVLVLLLLSTSNSVCQEGASGYLEDMSESNGIDIWERLEDLKVDPIPINKARKEDLIQIPWIDDLLADRIIEFRKSRGRFKSVEELLEVEGMSRRVHIAIIPFLKVEPGRKVMIRLDTRTGSGRSDAKLRLSSSGNVFNLGLKAVRYCTEERSALSGFILIRFPFLANFTATAGNQYLRLGQGLLAWSAFGALRSPERPVVFPLSGSGARGTTGTTGRKVIRGVSVKFSGEPLQLNFTGGVTGEGDRSLPVNSLTLATCRNTGLRLEFSVLSLGNSTLFTGGSAEFDLHQGRGFAEFVLGPDGESGVIAGMEKGSGSTAFLFLYRRLSHGYFAPLGFDMSLSGSGIGNLEAAYAGLVLGKGKCIEIVFFRDTGKRIYRGEDYSPTRFDESSILLAVKPSRKVKLTFSLSSKETESGRGGRDSIVRRKLRWDSILRPATGLFVRTRIQVSHGDTGGGWRSSLLFIELKKMGFWGFEVRGRFTSYNCSEGGYVYHVEGGLPERSMILRLSGEGERYQLQVTRRVRGGWTVRWKLSRSEQRISEYSSGFDLENWNAKTTVEFQLERRF
jgi:hypothetical protein